MPTTPEPLEPVEPQPAPPAAPTGAAASLADAVREVERHVARGGWDAPPRLFALVAVAPALAADPALAGALGPAVVAAAQADPHHLVSVEQEGLPASGTLEDLLAQVAWPPSVHGVAVVVERSMLPPGAEEGMPDDPAAALAWLQAHPQRQDVRMAVGVLRDGPAWCAVRTRQHDDDADVGFGPDLVPGLVEALRATLA